MVPSSRKWGGKAPAHGGRSSGRSRIGVLTYISFVRNRVTTSSHMSRGGDSISTGSMERNLLESPARLYIFSPIAPSHQIHLQIINQQIWAHEYVQCYHIITVLTTSYRLNCGCLLYYSTCMISPFAR